MFILAIIVVVVIFSIYKYGKSAKKRVSNPIDTIAFNSCMGFKLGDSKAFVLSRIKHLGLMNAEEKEDYDFENQMGYDKVLMYRHISTSRKKFNNIEDITFHITSNILSSIYISLKAEQCDDSTMVSIIEKKLTSQLGVPKYDKAWMKGDRVVVLNKDDMYVIIS